MFKGGQFNQALFTDRVQSNYSTTVDRLRKLPASLLVR